MGTNSSVYGPALRQACIYVRRHPKLPILARSEDLAGEVPLAKFMRKRPVKAWLSTCPYRRWHELTCDLLDKAYSYMFEGGEAKRVYALYSDQRRAGLLDNLSPTDRAIHRAIMALAIEQGTPVLASIRYVAVVVLHEFDLTPDPRTVARALQRLHDRHLIEYAPGTPGLKAQSGRISLAMPPRPNEPDLDALIDLSLSPATRIALADFRKSAKRVQATRYDKALSSRKQPSRPTSERAEGSAWVDEQLYREAILECSRLAAFLFADDETERTSGISVFRRSDEQAWPRTIANSTARPGAVALRSEDDCPDPADLAASRGHGRDERSYERFRSAAVDESVVAAKQHSKGEAR